MYDGAAVAEAINARMQELGITQTDLSSKSGVSLATLREVQHNAVARQRRPRTLSALSSAFGWPPGHLHRVSRGIGAGSGAAPAHTSTAPRSEYKEITEQLDALQAEVREIGRRLDERLTRLEQAVQPAVRPRREA